MSGFRTFDPSVRIEMVQVFVARMRVAKVGAGPNIVWIPGGDPSTEA